MKNFKGPNKSIVRPNDLPSLGIIRNSRKDYLTDFFDLEGLNVLCLGYSELEIDELIAKYNPASISVLTLWTDHIDAVPGKYPVSNGDITKKTMFADEQFDAVLSLSLLEHVSDLDSALLEMRRVTRKGGINCHMFGPAWSSAYGHHLCASPRPMMDFSLWKMPAFLHLLCSEADLLQWYLSNGYSEQDVSSARFWFYEADHINRLPYDRYLSLFSKHFTLEKSELMTLDVPQALLTTLRQTYNWIDFSTYGGKYLLRV